MPPHSDYANIEFVVVRGGIAFDLSLSSSSSSSDAAAPNDDVENVCSGECANNAYGPHNMLI